MKKLDIGLLVNNNGQIDGVPKNPRKINQDDYEKLLVSLKEDPDFLDHKPLHVYPYGEKYVVLGGNMRLKALHDLGWTEVPVTIYDVDTPVEILRRRVIVDNSNYGSYNEALLDAEWSSFALDDWGVKNRLEDINFDDIKDNADRERQENLQKVTCPECNHQFEV